MAWIKPWSKAKLLFSCMYTGVTELENVETLNTTPFQTGWFGHHSEHFKSYHSIHRDESTYIQCTISWDCIQSNLQSNHRCRSSPVALSASNYTRRPSYVPSRTIVVIQNRPEWWWHDMRTFRSSGNKSWLKHTGLDSRLVLMGTRLKSLPPRKMAEQVSGREEGDGRQHWTGLWSWKVEMLG